MAGCGRREKEAFEKLIHEKKHMVMPAEVFERTSADDKFAALVADSVGETDRSRVHQTYTSRNNCICVPLQRARKQGKAPPCNKVVVDVREFRSSLPNLLDLVRRSHH